MTDNNNRPEADPSWPDLNGSALTGQALRRQAEEVLRKKMVRVQDLEAMSPQEIERIIHDLQVYQVELEIQNEELRRTQRNLTFERERYFNLYNLAPVGYCTVSEQGVIVEANLTLATLLGWPRIELINRHLHQFIKKEDHDLFYLHRKHLFETGTPQGYKLWMVSRDGTPFWARHNATVAHQEDGTLLCCLMITDITAQRQVEQVLLESESRFRKALQDVQSVAVIGYGTEGTIRYWNRASEQVYGYLEREAIGRNLMDLIIPPEVREKTEEALRLMTESGQPPPASELSLRRKDGSPVTVFSSHSIVQVPEHEQEIFCIGIDLTERKQVEEALRESKNKLKLAQVQLQAANTDLEQKIEQRTRELQETHKQYLHVEKLSAIGKLSASIAHEFNNPLQGVLSILKGLRKRAILDQEDRELLEAAISESNRMKDLIRSLQDFNRPSSGRKMMMDVHESLDALLLLHTNDFRSKQITVERDYAENLPPIMVVPDQIKQVFLNLLTNAADACQSGGIITVSTRQKNDRVLVAIKDTGIGIKPADMEHIFRPFFTTKSEVKGTGLGLSVSYGIVKDHHGEIRVESQPGKGATFTILLPIKDGNEGSIPHPHESKGRI